MGSDQNAFDPVLELESRYEGKVDWPLWNRKRAELIQSLLNNRPPLPGISKRLSEAQQLELPCAVASSSPRDWVDPHLENLKLRQHFHSTRCLDDVKKPKPSPELFLLAAQVLEVEPSQVIVFEDSLNGLKAAELAGMSCVVIPSPVTQHLDFPQASLQLVSLDEMNLVDIIASL